MGGPCFKILKGTKLLGPKATDNFQIIKFLYPLNSGITWYSVEQCYQAQKFIKDDKTFSILQLASPDSNETDSQYGLRVWSLGQSGKVRYDWDTVKVEIMYLVNCAKYACNPQIHQDLIDTSPHKLVGGPSTWQWSMWNGRIQMLIRKKIQQGVDLADISTVSNEELIEMD